QDGALGRRARGRPVRRAARHVVGDPRERRAPAVAPRALRRLRAVAALGVPERDLGAGAAAERSRHALSSAVASAAERERTLDRDLDWDELAGICEDAWAQVAPRSLLDAVVARLHEPEEAVREQPGGR